VPTPNRAESRIFLLDLDMFCRRTVFTLKPGAESWVTRREARAAFVRADVVPQCGEPVI
jgi:hypothetical protein